MEPVPLREITSRVALLQRKLAPEGIDLALLRQAADLFYYTGTVVDGFLALAPAGPPLLMVRRPQYRVMETEIPWPLAFYQDLKEITGLLAAAGIQARETVGLELDVLPAALYKRIQEQLFPQQAIQDLSPLIRLQRMVKSPYELEQLRRAAAILDQVHARVPEFLKPGVTELEVAAAVEYHLRLLGHQGLIRVRNVDLEMYYGHVLSGTSGLQGAYIDTPSGGVGFSPAFPQGASLKKLAAGEPISIDVAACVNGYVADMTRLYALESLPPKAWEAFEVAQELYRLFAAEARPGVMPAELYQRLQGTVQAHGLEDCYMGQGVERVSFLAHGVGLELDEYPFLTARFPYPLEADAVLAFEPKFFLAGIGMVGQEDTGRITPQGVEWLTRSPRQVTLV